jgi:hypothetical protein
METRGRDDVQAAPPRKFRKRRRIPAAARRLGVYYSLAPGMVIGFQFHKGPGGIINTKDGVYFSRMSPPDKKMFVALTKPQIPGGYISQYGGNDSPGHGTCGGFGHFVSLFVHNTRTFFAAQNIN